MSVGAGGNVVKYKEIANELVREIDARGLAPGTQLESHADLVERFGVSRGTITKALSVLENRGFVTTEQGRGTFVRSTVLRSYGSVMRSFSENVLAGGRTPGATLISLDQVEAGVDPLGGEFEDGAPLTQLRRLRTVDELVVGIHRVLVSRQLADKLNLVAEATADPGLSLYSLLTRAGIHFATAVEEIDAVAASDTTAAELGVEPNVPLLRVRRFSADSLGRPIEAVEALYLPDRFHLRVSAQDLT